MKAVILAAGIGSRLGNLTIDKPKCMLPIRKKDQTLIKYQIKTLKNIGIKEEDIYIIAGYKLEKLKNHLKNFSINIVFNPKYREWNNVYSFYLIKDLPFNEEFILLNSDTYYHPDILKKLINSDIKNKVVLDTYKKMADEEMKVVIEDRYIKKFGKDIPSDQAFGEYIGMGKFRKEDLKELFKEIEILLKKGYTNIWYENAFNFAIEKDLLKITYITTERYPWIEIDNLNDYKNAIELNI